jgi:competence CoiA-like predicted nuclease
MQHRIPFIFDNTTGKQYDTEELLSEFNTSPESKSDARTKVHNAIIKKKPIYVCAACKQAVRLCGGVHEGKNASGNSFRTIYFKHWHSNIDCPFNSKNTYSHDEINRMKFHGQKEGEMHRLLKNTISESLKKEGYDTYVEQRVTLMQLHQDGLNSETFAKCWRKPDIRVEKGEKKFVVEIQLATTFLSVILERMNFYKEVSHNIIWVLSDFNTDEVQKFTTMDIVSVNNRNIFVLDADMREETQRTGKLVLKCYYDRPIIVNEKIAYVWESKVVNMDDIVFDSNNTVYYYDCWDEEKKLKQQITEKHKQPDTRDEKKDVYNIVTKNESVTLLSYKKDARDYSDPEDYFVDIVNSEIKCACNCEFDYYSEFYKDILNKNIAGIEFSLDYHHKKKNNPPSISNDFFHSLLMLRNEPGYGKLIRTILPHPIFLYSFDEVFSDIENPFDLAWDLTESYEQLLSFLNLFHNRNRWLNNNDIKYCTVRLEQNTNNNNTAFDEDRYAVEKYELTIMYDKIMQHNNKEMLIEMFDRKAVHHRMVRLAAYSIGHPLDCEFKNLQAMTSLFLGSNKDVAHLAIKMIESYGWSNDLKIKKNYSKLKLVPESDLNHEYDELAQVLFDRLR